jgi:hypothetical protein
MILLPRPVLFCWFRSCNGSIQGKSRSLLQPAYYVQPDIHLILKALVSVVAVCTAAVRNVVVSNCGLQHSPVSCQGTQSYIADV